MKWTPVKWIDGSGHFSIEVDLPSLHPEYSIKQGAEELHTSGSLNEAKAWIEEFRNPTRSEAA